MAKSKWGKFNDALDLKTMGKEVYNADSSGGNYPEVPKGTYEVELVSLEQKLAKSSGNPMVAVSFKILSGEYKGQRLFDNKPIFGTQNDERMRNSIMGFLYGLDSGVDIFFAGFDQFEELMLEIHEAVQGKLEYAVEYDPDAFFKMSIKEVFEVEAD